MKIHTRRKKYVKFTASTHRIMRIARTVRSAPNGDPDFSPLRPTPREYAVTPTTRTSNIFQPSLKKQVPNANKRNSNSAEKMQCPL